MSSGIKCCPRCGLDRAVNRRRPNTPCTDCKVADRGEVASDPELPRGHWEVRKGVRHYVIHECHDCGGYLAPGDRCDTCLTWAVKNARDWTWRQISKQHRAYILAVIERPKQTRKVAA